LGCQGEEKKRGEGRKWPAGLGPKERKEGKREKGNKIKRLLNLNMKF
jgi:hypothetical protein